ncbi:hypothetical protein CONLIGDRAFT_681485 [Coniochaeta ligniaria NRRL 30616]|uniref:Uncharacterized protein n=1 Tax=Coniochaeta ligniaria NRRL 30616 TaxID=1408157 RepID=A0A1J7IMU9_9PEZI|nr:hypothetical protein CONLIGDRAFT_681485 [Coniochaeta ligniaria NRRL 30616]
MSRLQDLPLLHPSLTLHLSDNADTPIISSAPPPPAIQPSSPPPAARPRPRSTRSAAISSLSRSALASYTAAQRLGLGSPVRIMVECVSTYNNSTNTSQSQPQNGTGSSSSSTASGPMVLNTFIPPLQPPPPPPASSRDARGAPNGAESSSRTTTTVKSYPGTSPGGAGLEADGGDGSKRPPLLVAVVVTPDGESQTVADARVAAARLARVGRRLQARWAEEEDGGQNGDG